MSLAEKITLAEKISVSKDQQVIIRIDFHTEKN